jgi:hypothetical protein
MKKTYAAPTLVGNGNVVHETLGGSPVSTGETNFKAGAAGSVGFYL